MWQHLTRNTTEQCYLAVTSVNRYLLQNFSSITTRTHYNQSECTHVSHSIFTGKTVSEGHVAEDPGMSEGPDTKGGPGVSEGPGFSESPGVSLVIYFSCTLAIFSYSNSAPIAQDMSDCMFLSSRSPNKYPLALSTAFVTRSMHSLSWQHRDNVSDHV